MKFEILKIVFRSKLRSWFWNREREIHKNDKQKHKHYSGKQILKIFKSYK